MRKKPVVPCGPANSRAGTVLGSSAITPEMHKILGNMERYDPSTVEDNEKFFRDAVGKLFIAALEQMYQQQDPKKKHS
jgi:hypothetical protein